MKYPVPPLFSSQVQCDALRYWEQARPGGGQAPSFSQFDPCDVPQLLPHVVLYDVLEEPRDFSYRLIGGDVRDRLHSNPVGMCCSRLPHQNGSSQMWKRLCEAVDSGRPVYHAVDYIGPDTEVNGQQSLVLPYRRGGAQVDMLLAIVEFVRA